MEDNTLFILIEVIAFSTVSALIFFIVISVRIIRTLNKADALIKDMHKNVNTLSYRVENLLGTIEQKASGSISKLALGSFFISTVLSFLKKK